MSQIAPKEPMVFFFFFRNKITQGRRSIYQFLLPPVGQMQLRLEAQSPCIHGLYGFKEIVLDQSQVRILNWEHGQVNTLELPCSIWLPYAKCSYLSLIQITQKKVPQLLSPYFKVLDRPHVDCADVECCRKFYGQPCSTPFRFLPGSKTVSICHHWIAQIVSSKVLLMQQANSLRAMAYWSYYLLLWLAQSSPILSRSNSNALPSTPSAFLFKNVLASTAHTQVVICCLVLLSIGLLHSQQSVQGRCCIGTEIQPSLHSLCALGWVCPPTERALFLICMKVSEAGGSFGPLTIPRA